MSLFRNHELATKGKSRRYSVISAELYESVQEKNTHEQVSFDCERVDVINAVLIAVSCDISLSQHPWRSLVPMFTSAQ